MEVEVEVEVEEKADVLQDLLERPFVLVSASGGGEI